VSRNIDKLREKSCLSSGVELENGGFLKVEIKGDLKKLPNLLRSDVVDNRILAVALTIRDEFPEERVVLISKDINMRIKADALGLDVQDYETNKIEISELYEGKITIETSIEAYNRYIKSGKMKPEELMESEPLPNEFINFKQEAKEAFGMYNKSRKRIERLKYGDISAWGIRAKNTEQSFAFEMLMDPDIKLVTLVGKAGTGKTLIALASGLEQVVERKIYKKLYVARPIIPMGKDIGYLPGSEKDKLKPWMQPIYDNFDFITESKEEKAGEKVIYGLETMGLLKIEALTYIRGRSIPGGFLIIDEAQNLTPHEVKTIVTRAAENTKIVFTGDPYQIDNPYLDSNSNGLTYLAERMKGEEIAGHITLIKGERSPLAEIAARLL
jgi:PhoH-like ATPase